MPKANRTKNNVRPSSSGRSAELLSSKVSPGLVEPGNLFPALFPSIVGSMPDQPLSNEFQLCFKKINKKDPTTKIKALTELKELVAKSSKSEVVNALGSWTHYYPSLTIDTDRKVREATQACHGDIVRKCGRQVALHIKRLLPAWLMAEHDEYPPVKLIVQKDLHSTFPDNKLAEAITFCKVDICNLYMDNLKGNAEYMLSGKKIDDEEERAAQQARVMSCTLHALRLLLATLPAARDGWLWAALQPLLCANTFWKLAAHPAPTVRAGFYVVLGGLVEVFHAELPGEQARRCARTLLAAPEAAPAVCLERWRALEPLLVHMKDMLDVQDNKDLMLKRFWELLENAAWGEAARVASLTSLLERLAGCASEAFFNRLFRALLIGLRQMTVVANETQCRHWNDTIALGLRYVTEEHRREQYAARLAAHAHRAWLERVLSVPRSRTKGMYIDAAAAAMGQLLNTWLRPLGDGENPVVETVVRSFWLNVRELAAELEKLPPDGDEVVESIGAHVRFQVTLRSNIDPRGDSDDPRPPEVHVPDHLDELEGATEALVGFALRVADEHRLVGKILPAVMPVFKKYLSGRLISYLVGKFEVESAFDFYDKVLKAWLNDERQRCETAAELVFLLAPHLDTQHQDAVFNSFGELSSEVVRWCLSLALRPERGSGEGHESGGENAAARWLRSAAAGRALVALAHLDTDLQAQELLLKALAHDDQYDVLVSDETVDGIVRVCTELLEPLVAHDAEITLPGAGPAGGGRSAAGAEPAGGGRGVRREDPFGRLEPRVSFAARLLHTLPARRTPAACPLLLALFRLTLRVPVNSPLLGAEAWSDALGAWRDTARRLPRDARAAFVRDALRHLHWHVRHDMERLNVARVEHVVSLCPHFMVGGDGEPAPADPAPLLDHSRLLLESTASQPPAQAKQLPKAVESNQSPQPEQSPLPPLELFALQVDVVWGDLSCPFERDNGWVAAAAAGEAALAKRTLIAHAYNMLFRALYVRALLLRPARAPPAARTWCADLIRLEFFREQFYNILHDYSVVNVLYDHYAFWKHYDIICELKTRLEGVVRDIVAEAPAEARGALAAGLAERAAAHGYYWAYAKHHYRRFLHNLQKTDPMAEESPEDLSEFRDAQEEPDSERADSSQLSQSSYEVVGAEGEAGCTCHQLHASAEEVFSPLLLGRLRAECGRERSLLSQADKPAARLATSCEKAALYVDLLGELMLKNGYFHDAQVRALKVKKLKQLAKAKFDQLQDAALAELEMNGQHAIFDKWADEPAAYRRVGVDVDESALYTAKDYAMLRAYYCEYAARAPVDPLLADVAAENTACNLDAVINGYYRHNETMLFERSLKSASWTQLCGTAATLDLLGEAVAARGWDAPALHWDFANIALCSALTSLQLSAAMFAADPLRLALVARPTLELFVRVRRFISGVPRECRRRQPAAHVAALPREWAAIFAPDANANIYYLAVHVLEGSSQSVSASQAAMLQVLAEAARLLEAGALRAVLRGGRVPLERAVGVATRALAGTAHRGYKYLAYYTLRSLAPCMIEADETRLAALAVTEELYFEPAADDDSDDDHPVAVADLTLGWYHDHLLRLQELVDAALDSYVICEDSCSLVPHSDSHSLVLGYLLLVVALHRHCELAAGDLFVHYGTIFKARGYVEGVLRAALRLLPAPVAHYMAARLPALPHTYRSWFIRLQDFTLEEPCSEEVVSRLACGVVLRALGGPGGAGARGWWAVQRAPVGPALARLVASAVAPPLLNHQLAEVQARAKDLGTQAKVSVCWSTRTATCSLRGGAAAAAGGAAGAGRSAAGAGRSAAGAGRAPALRVTLSAAHPLHAPRVTSLPPGPDPHWITLYLGHRNGRVIDAMHMWLRAVRMGQCEPGEGEGEGEGEGGGGGEGEGEGEEESGKSGGGNSNAYCFVCYCRAHPQDGTPAAVNCGQCQNSFHSRCLRRWFRTSNRSNCPICRTNF